jgi:hypothetical protein
MKSGSKYQNSQGQQVIDDFSEMSSSNFSIGQSNKLNHYMNKENNRQNDPNSLEVSNSQLQGRAT